MERRREGKDGGGTGDIRGHSTCCIDVHRYHMYVAPIHIHAYTPTHSQDCHHNSNASASWCFMLNSPQTFQYVQREHTHIWKFGGPRPIHCTNPTNTDLMHSFTTLVTTLTPINSHTSVMFNPLLERNI